MDKRERVARAIAESGFGRSWSDFRRIDAFDTDQSDLLRYADAAIASLEPVTVQEAARVLCEMPKEDRMKVWRATRGCPTGAEFGKWFCKGLRARANDEEAAAMQEMADDDKAHAARERMWEDG